MTDLHFILQVFPGVQVIQISRSEYVAVENGRHLTTPKKTEMKAWYAAFLLACEQGHNLLRSVTRKTKAHECYWDTAEGVVDSGDSFTMACRGCGQRRMVLKLARIKAPAARGRARLAVVAMVAVMAMGLSARADELPNAPEPVPNVASGGVVASMAMVSARARARTRARVNERRFEGRDWALVAGEFAARVGDLVTTMQCQGDAKWEQFQTGIGASTYWKNVGCREYELPQAFVATKGGFAAYSFGMAGLQAWGQWELTRHGHREMARRLAMVSIGATAGQVVANKVMQNRH